MKVRRYGTAGPWVVLVHGGPGAGGYLAPLAEELENAFRILEPLQRGSGPEPLTVARHVEDLEGLVREHCEGTKPTVVGHSWGAMLALAHAAAHPASVGALVLVGCGTFDVKSRRQFQATVEARTTDALRRRIARVEAETADPDDRLRQLGNLLLPLYSHDLEVTQLATETCDARAHDETWQDMLRLQERGLYPSAFTAITAPVLMMHGDVDPHPGRAIEATLRPHLPRLEYREWQSCGHYPWLERGVREEFVKSLRERLTRGARPVTF